MRIFKDKTIGLLGAIIIHLAAAIIFMLVQLEKVSNNEASEILLEFTRSEEIPVSESRSQVPSQGTEDLYNSNIERTYNIARNVATQGDEKINIEDYIDKVKEELIQSGKLGKDNYIDEQKKNKEITSNDDNTVNMISEAPAADNKNDLEKMASAFTGPTRIYYDLPGRYHTYLPIPIYKCEGSGKVTLTIEVNSIGTVVKAEIIASESSTADECLVETALGSALISKFNPDVNASKIQVGTLTYNFVAQ
jgi:hypothetical protein